MFVQLLNVVYVYVFVSVSGYVVFPF